MSVLLQTTNALNKQLLATRKVEALMKKYVELQQNGKVESFLRKRRERASRKKQKYMPKTRVL